MFLLDISRYIIYSALLILIFNVGVTNDVSNISLLWAVLVFTAQSFLFIYGLLNRFYSYVIVSGTIILGVSYIFYLKLKHLQNIQFVDIV